MIGIGLMLGGYIVYLYQAQSIHEANSRQLANIARLKIEEISSWRRERIGNLEVSAGSPFFREGVGKLLADPDNEILRRQVWERLDLIKTSYEYQNVMVVLPDGEVLASADPVEGELMPADLRIVRQVSDQKKTSFSEFFRDSYGTIHLDLAGAVLDDQGQVEAVLLFRVNPQTYLYPLLQTWPIESQTIETLIVMREGENCLFLNPLRHVDYAPLTFRIPLTETDVPSVQAVLGKTGAFEGTDHRNVRVISYLQAIPETPWFMVSKVDQAEIQAQIWDMGEEILVIVVLALSVTAITAVFVFNFRRRRLYARLLEAEKKYSASIIEKRAVLYGIGDGVIAVNRAGQVTLLNPVAEQLTGWKENEACGRPFEDVFVLIDELTRQPMESPIRLVLEEGRVVEMANHSLLISRDGREVPVADSAAPIRDDREGIIGVVLVFRDQTLDREVQKERALYNDTLSASLNEIYIFDSEGLYYRSANPGALKNLGVTVEELQELNPFEIKTGFTRHSFQQLIQPLVRNEQAGLQYETYHRRMDGSLYPVECHLQIIDRYGERLFLEVALDITIRRQAEEALRQSEERHRLLADNAHDIIWTTDREERFTYISPSFEQILGFKSEEFLGKPFADNLPPEAAATVENALKDNLLGVQLGLPFKGARFEFDQPRKDGSTVWVEVTVSGMYNDEGAFVGMVGVTRDISERHRFEEALRESEERHRLLANNTHDVIWATDLEGRITYISPSVHEMLGHPPDYYLGRVFQENLPPKTAVKIKRAILETLETGKSGGPVKILRFDIEWPLKKRVARWLDATVSGMYNEQNEFIGLVGVARDITERHEAQVKLSYRLHFEELISRISTRFINLPTNQADPEIIQALNEIGNFIEADRAFVFAFDQEKTGFQISHEWCRPEMESRSSELTFLNLLEHHAWVNALMRNESIVLEGAEQITAFHGSDGANPLPGVNSVAIFPLWMNQRLYGCVGFDTGSPGPKWGEDSLSLLQQFSNILSTSFERTRLILEIERRAVRDELTGVYNRRGLTEIAQAELHRANRYHHPLGMIFFDIDHFKHINDTLGHAAGDLVLQEVARRSSEIIRDVDILCRWGGDEFLVLLPESDLQFSCQVGERLHECISSEPFWINGEERSIRISVGISGAADANISLEEMLHNADESLYAAKETGRNKVHCGKFQ